MHRENMQTPCRKIPGKYQVYPTCRNTLGVLGLSVTMETWATKFSSEPMEAKIEDFLWSFGECLAALSEDAFNTQGMALIKPRKCEDAHLEKEVDHNCFKVVTQQYLFSRLHKEVNTTHTHTHTHTHTIETNTHTTETQQRHSSTWGPFHKDVTLISDIRSFTSTLPLHPYHKILSQAPPLPQDPQPGSAPTTRSIARPRRYHKILSQAPPLPQDPQPGPAVTTARPHRYHKSLSQAPPLPQDPQPGPAATTRSTARPRRYHKILSQAPPLPQEPQPSPAPTTRSSARPRPYHKILNQAPLLPQDPQPGPTPTTRSSYRPFHYHKILSSTMLGLFFLGVKFKHVK
uniref:Uncharacterized protein n=1 Tax=Amphiprion percula TaxID=161767 RepID=A0A3P8SUD5_AMPPE